MEFGINLRRIKEPREMAAVAKLAEDNGFTHVYLSDSHAYWSDVYVNLAFFAEHTSEINVGTGVANPVTRHPTVTASSILTIEELSNGRAFLGYGRGGSALNAIGRKSLPSLQETKESVELMRAFWSGEEFEVGETEVQRKWGRDPRIPVYIAAEGPKMMALAGEVGDGVMISHVNDPGELERRIDVVGGGGDPGETEIISYLTTSVSDDRQDAYDLSKPKVVDVLRLNPKLGEACGIDFDVDEIRRISDRIGDHSPTWLAAVEESRSVSTEAVKSVTLSGTIDEVVDEVDELEAVGVDQLVIRPFFSHPGPDRDEFTNEHFIEQFGEHVIPEFSA